MSTARARSRNPWTWIPSLYFAEGIPYVVVMTVSVIMYKRLGLSNADIALYTSWLYLPWVIKPLWSPFVDMFRTKRFWIVTMQLLIGASLGAVALTLPLPGFVQYTLAVFWLMAFSSATHDIAADGFYMLGLDQHDQAAFVGVRSTFYRVAMITGQGILVVLAGFLETNSGGNIPGAWSITFIVLAAVFLCFFLYHKFVLPYPAVDMPARAEGVHGVSGTLTEFFRVFALFFSPARDFVVTAALPGAGHEKMQSEVTGKIEDALKSIAGVDRVESLSGDGVSTVVVRFTPEVSGRQGHLHVDDTIEAVKGSLPAGTRDLVVRPITPGSSPAPAVALSNLAPANGSEQENGSFFLKPSIGVTLAFLLLYRFAEAQLMKLVSPFLLDQRVQGGLGLTTSEVGIVYGTVGVIALTLGGLLGGYLVSRQGLRFWLWPMVLIMHLPDAMFVYLSQVQPENFLLINAAVAVEQFGYGFGFTAYMLFMILVADGKYKTAHYAICTGFMALGMMIPGMFSGAWQEYLGYKNFFLWVLLSTIPGFIVAALVRIPADFGKKRQKEIA